MYNKSQLSKDRKLAKEPKGLAKPKDIDYVSKMGYRDDSPFNTRPYIDINTPNGVIDMSQTGTPLLANGRYLAPYSGLHQFDTNVVREVPLAEEGGTIMELTEDEIKKYRDAGYVVDLTPYPERHNPANAFPVTDPRSMQDGGNFYTLKGSKGVYRKVGDTWEVDWNRTGNFQPISKGNVKERVANLNKNAQLLYDKDYTTMMGVKSEAPVPENPFTTNFVNKFGITDQAIENASAVAPTVENAQKLERLAQQKAYEDSLRQIEAAARQRENELLEQSKFINVPLSQVSDETQIYTDDVERQAIAGAPAAREARKRQAEFEKQQWEKYNKMSTFERIMDRTKGFMVDPLGMTSRALMGEQGYIPGMGEGLLNKDDPDYYKYLVAAGYTPGEFDMFDVQSMVNPMYWGASMGNNINRGNYLDAGIEAALTFAPMVPKGTISQGARMLGDDVSRGVNYLTTKTPVKNTYKLNPNALKENPEMFLYRAEPTNFDTRNTVKNLQEKLANNEGTAVQQARWKNYINEYNQGHPKLVAQNDFHGQWLEKDPARLDWYLHSGDKVDVGTPMSIFRTKIPTSQAAQYNVGNIKHKSSIVTGKQIGRAHV